MDPPAPHQGSSDSTLHTLVYTPIIMKWMNYSSLISFISVVTMSYLCA
jgi:hypothetical protein